MSKTEVYSWRLSPDVKRSLEDEAKRRELTLAQMLDQIAQDWLAQHGENDSNRDRILARARPFIGAIAGGGGRRSERVRDLVRRRLKAKHGR